MKIHEILLRLCKFLGGLHQKSQSRVKRLDAKRTKKVQAKISKIATHELNLFNL